jgi:hypothetical protein
VGHPPVAQGNDLSKAAKIIELVKLQGLEKMMEQSKVSSREAASKLVGQMTDKMFASFPQIPTDTRAAIEAAAQRFLQDVEASSDQNDAVQAWSRFYSDGLTEHEIDAILAYYRSKIGQKDVLAQQAALPQFQKYLQEKHSAAMSLAVSNYTQTLKTLMESAKAKAGSSAEHAPPSSAPTQKSLVPSQT